MKYPCDATLFRLIRIELQCAKAVCRGDYLISADIEELETARKECRFSYDPINDRPTIKEPRP